MFGKRTNEMLDGNSTIKNLNVGQLKPRSQTGKRDICQQCCYSDICNAGSLCGTTGNYKKNWEIKYKERRCVMLNALNIF